VISLCALDIVHDDAVYFALSSDGPYVTSTLVPAGPKFAPLNTTPLNGDIDLMVDPPPTTDTDVIDGDTYDVVDMLLTLV
jgi:hypothetical protein